MEVPINCPVCKDSLRNDFGQLSGMMLAKFCENKIDHYIRMTISNNKIIDISIAIDSQRKYLATWFLDISKLVIYERKMLANKINLPFFEPDLNNYKLLMEKIKSYMVFA